MWAIVPPLRFHPIVERSAALAATIVHPIFDPPPMSYRGNIGGLIDAAVFVHQTVKLAVVKHRFQVFDITSFTVRRFTVSAFDILSHNHSPFGGFGKYAQCVIQFACCPRHLLFTVRSQMLNPYLVNTNTLPSLQSGNLSLTEIHSCTVTPWAIILSAITSFLCFSQALLFLKYSQKLHIAFGQVIMLCSSTNFSLTSINQCLLSILMCIVPHAQHVHWTQ